MNQEIAIWAILEGLYPNESISMAQFRQREGVSYAIYVGKDCAASWHSFDHALRRVQDKRGDDLKLVWESLDRDQSSNSEVDSTRTLD